MSVSKLVGWLISLVALATFLLYYTDVLSGIDEKLAFEVAAIRFLIYAVWLCFSIFLLIKYFEEKYERNSRYRQDNQTKENLGGYDGYLAEEDRYKDPDPSEENEDDNLTSC